MTETPKWNIIVSKYKTVKLACAYAMWVAFLAVLVLFNFSNAQSFSDFAYMIILPIPLLLLYFITSVIIGVAKLWFYSHWGHKYYNLEVPVRRR